MASKAATGIGTKLHRLVDSMYQHIAEVVDIKGPSMKNDKIEVTSLDSVGGFKEYIMGMTDPGELKATMNFRRDTYEILLADFQSKEIVDWKISMEDQEHTTFSFSAFVMDLPLDIPKDKQISCDVTLAISGQISLNSASGS